MFHGLPLAWRDPGLRMRRGTQEGVHAGQHLREQTKHAFLDPQPIDRPVLSESVEERPLGKVGSWRARAVGPPEGAVGAVVHARVVVPHRVEQDARLHGEPLAVVAHRADRTARVPLSPVVEGHHVGVGQKCRLSLVAQLHHGGAFKN